MGRITHLLPGCWGGEWAQGSPDLDLGSPVLDLDLGSPVPNEVWIWEVWIWVLHIPLRHNPLRHILRHIHFPLRQIRCGVAAAVTREHQVSSRGRQGGAEDEGALPLSLPGVYPCTPPCVVHAAFTPLLLDGAGAWCR